MPQLRLQFLRLAIVWESQVVHVPAQKSDRHFGYDAFSFHQLEVPLIICEIIHAFQVSSTTSLVFPRFSRNALVKMLSRYLYFCSTLSKMAMSFAKRKTGRLIDLQNMISWLVVHFKQLDEHYIPFADCWFFCNGFSPVFKPNQSPVDFSAPTRVTTVMFETPITDSHILKPGQFWGWKKICTFGF
jgi:hypothetical protein